MNEAQNLMNQDDFKVGGVNLLMEKDSIKEVMEEEENK